MLSVDDALAPADVQALDMADLLASVPPDEIEPVWHAQPGPQTAACESLADVIGYGGAAGGGKSDLALGLAGTHHERSLIFRRVFPSLRGMIERSRQIFNRANQSHADDSFNESTHVWRLADGRMIEFGAVQYEADLKKWQGQPHDFLAFDEATEFPEAFIRFLWAWLRTTVTGLHCQLLLTFNPPFDDSGAWVVRFFAPWLDPQHPNPAADGELRWYAMVDGKEVECGSGAPFEHDGAVITPKSRTFFHAALKDNPILEASGYGATIDALPEPLRSLLRGNFDAAKVADPWQCIPSAWVKLAQARWTEKPPVKEPDTVGADLARGGKDKMSISRIFENWFAPIETHPGTAVPDGPSAAALLLWAVKLGIKIGVDVIGIGTSVYDSLVTANADVLAVNNSESAEGRRDKSGRFKFRNVRAASYWSFREALDPDHGEKLALPPDAEMSADLCAPRFSVTTMGIQLESKDEIKERLGRSPDKGDSVVIAWWTKINSRLQLWV